MPNNRIIVARSFFALALFSTSIASGAPAERNTPLARVAPVGSRFNDIGKVIFHRGQPCTPQIMFDFHGTAPKIPVWLAVNAHEEKVLIEAANKRRRVRISGKWQRGRAKGCAYVSVSAVEVQKSKTFWLF